MTSIDPRTRLGLVELRVTDLDRSVQFYQRHLGFATSKQEGSRAVLGAGGRDLLTLVGGDYVSKSRGTTGLYHFAILVPSRRDLADSLRRLVRERTAMQGFADHGVSEALYLADPDGNGIEVYRDRPRGEWPRAQGVLQMGVDPLDVDALLAVGDDEGLPPAMPAGTTIGHVHLHVANLRDAEEFYSGVLGFDIMQRFGPGALFVSAGGYHHHLGLNTWAGVGAPPPSDRAVGLSHFVVELPDRQAFDAVAQRIARAPWPSDSDADRLIVLDPSGNRVRLQFPPEK